MNHSPLRPSLLEREQFLRIHQPRVNLPELLRTIGVAKHELLDVAPREDGLIDRQRGDADRRIDEQALTIAVRALAILLQHTGHHTTLARERATATLTDGSNSIPSVR